MLKGIDVNQRIEFTSQYDTEETKTVFVFRPLTSEEKNNLKSPVDGSVKLMGTAIFDFLEKCIVEIRNFELGATIREKLVSIKDERVVAELITFGGSLSEMSGQDAKNS
jgi:hypothetical protein